MGGMFGESKFAVLSLIPEEVSLKSILIRQPANLSQVLDALEKNGLSVPLIFKPDLGERGFMVKRILRTEDISAYLQNMKHDFIAQELADLPLEFGVFYKRMPSESHGEVTSIVMKEMLSVTGDGISSLRELILEKDRAKLHAERLQIEHRERWNTVIPKGELIEVVSIGNHCLGTKFINANHLITPKLSANFHNISKRIPGFYFGRYDLRCASVADLCEGRVKIMELNGCGAEPAHIYDPNFSLLRAIVTLISHWRTIFLIARENRSRGHRFIPLTEALGHYRNFKNKLR